MTMAQGVRRAARTNGNGATLGFEATLWAAADKMRGNLDAAEYKHVVLGLIFLKYVSDAFEQKHADLTAKIAEGYNPEDPDEYTSETIFWVPPEARWSHIRSQARQPTIGRTIDDAMIAIERDNAKLKGILPKTYAREALDKRRLGEVVDLISNLGFVQEAIAGETDEERQARLATHRSLDTIGRVYEYFLGQFASAEGKKGGEFYTPRAVVRLLVEMLAPDERSRIYDPCCGSGGMFVQSEKFIEAHGGRRGAAAIYGQELNDTTWRLCQMNLAIRGIEGNIARADTLHDDRHRDLRADFVLANPPFNISDWGGEQLRDDVRWQYGVPPVGNANYAWVQHFIAHLAPSGTAGFVLANGSMSSNTGGEGDIRRRIVEADLVDCMVAMPGQLFYSTQIPVCLWFLARGKGGRTTTDRRGQTLFIDARKLGTLIDRTHRELSDEEIARVAGTYHAWRGDAGAGEYADIPGFCKSATTEEIAAHGFVLTPGRYVGAEDTEDDDEPFEEKMQRLVATLEEQFAENERLQRRIRENIRGFVDVN